VTKKDQELQPRFRWIMARIKQNYTAKDACRNMGRGGRTGVYDAFRGNAILTGHMVQRIVDSLGLNLPVYPPPPSTTPVETLPEYERIHNAATALISEGKAAGMRVTVHMEEDVPDLIRDAMEAVCPAE